MFRKLLTTSDDWTLALMRLVLGVVFFAHGAQKMLGWFGGYGFSGTMNGLSTEALDPSTAFEGVFKNGAAFNEKVKLLWIGTGTVERDSNPNILRLHEDLDKHGIKHVYFESPGTAHEWLTWRRDLADFAPRLFQ